MDSEADEEPMEQLELPVAQLFGEVSGRALHHLVPPHCFYFQLLLHGTEAQPA